MSREHLSWWHTEFCVDCTTTTPIVNVSWKNPSKQTTFPVILVNMACDKKLSNVYDGVVSSRTPDQFPADFHSRITNGIWVSMWASRNRHSCHPLWVRYGQAAQASSRLSIEHAPDDKAGGSHHVRIDESALPKEAALSKDSSSHIRMFLRGFRNQKSIMAWTFNVTSQQNPPPYGLRSFLHLYLHLHYTHFFYSLLSIQEYQHHTQAWVSHADLRYFVPRV